MIELKIMKTLTKGPRKTIRNQKQMDQIKITTAIEKKKT